MLRSIKQLYGNKLGGSDGDIGHIKDFYFDDQDWAIRYMAADTSDWLPGRKVLLSKHSLGRLDPSVKILNVDLTRKQIENSPAIEWKQPISRQFETEYFKYFGWPSYWEGVKGPNVDRATGDLVSKNGEHLLRSTQAVTGYIVRQGGVTLGHVCDFMMDAENWMIGQIVVRTGHRFSGTDLLIESKLVDRISHDESTVLVKEPEKPEAPSIGTHQLVKTAVG